MSNTCPSATMKQSTARSLGCQTFQSGSSGWRAGAVITALWLSVAALERKRAACFAPPMKSTLRLAALAGFLAVALGAFGAHSLRPRLELLGTAWIWDKAVLYHLLHAVALLALALG